MNIVDSGRGVLVEAVLLGTAGLVVLKAAGCLGGALVMLAVDSQGVALVDRYRDSLVEAASHRKSAQMLNSVAQGL